VDGEARIVHSDCQDRYDGDLSNCVSRCNFDGEIDNHYQIADRSNLNPWHVLRLNHIIDLIAHAYVSSTTRDKNRHNSRHRICIYCDALDRMHLS